MTKQIDTTLKTIGQAPGALIYVGTKKTEEIKITLTDYNETVFTKKEIKDIKEILTSPKPNMFRWINISGLYNVRLIEEIGNFFKLHPIVLENIVNTTQRTSWEDFEDYIYITAKYPYWNKTHSKIETDQISMIFGNNYLITFMEQESAIFDPIYNRLNKNNSRIKKMGLDFLVYSLLDVLVDNYFLVLEEIEDKVEKIEDDLLANPTLESLQNIQDLKRDLILLRKSIWPMREVANAFQISDSDLIKSKIGIYLKNLHDHTIQIIEIIETFKDLMAGMVDIYLSSLSNKTNIIMKVLTVIATIFIPLTFLAGLYGMNFNTRYKFNMPELNWKYGYFFVLSIMFVISISMLLYFKKKKWF